MFFFHSTELSDTNLRVYERSDCAVFRATKERWGEFSNMAPDFPITFSGITFRTSEALYQCCRYPHLPKVQELIIDQRSPMTAKMKSKPYRDKSRPDWDRHKVKFMRWALQLKLLHNWERFSEILLSSGDLHIVEESSKDQFWGARPIEHSLLEGFNVLGRLLMELREQLAHEPASLKLVEPPEVEQFRILGISPPTMELLSGTVFFHDSGTVTQMSCRPHENEQRQHELLKTLM